VIVALVLVPSVAVAAVSYTGIEGTSGDKANVTPAGQLLTTEAKPISYQTYISGASRSTNSSECFSTTPALPSGDAYVIRDVSVAFGYSEPQSLDGSNQNESGGAVALYAANYNLCGSGKGSLTELGDVIAPGGNAGTFDLPFAPGNVVPNGWQVYGEVSSAAANLVVNGYLVPSSDAPSTRGESHRSTPLLRDEGLTRAGQCRRKAQGAFGTLRNLVTSSKVMARPRW
jgi:hypothetical protein